MFKRVAVFHVLLLTPFLVSGRLQDIEEVVRPTIIPDADSPFWKICSESLVATSASHVTLAMAVPRALVDADFVWSLTGRLGAITVMDARDASVIGRQVIALIVTNQGALFSLLDTNPRLWWPIAYYVISAPELSPDYKKFCRSLWDRYRVRNTILVVESSDRVVATYNPFITSSSDGHLFIFKVKEFSFVVEDYTTILNLHRLPVRITIFPSLPTAIPQPDGTYIGYDGMLLRTVSEKMNFTPILSRPSDGELFGGRHDDGTYSGALRDIVEEKSDITFNGFFIQDHRSDKLDFSTYITQNKVCFIVPKAGTMPRVITIFNCFRPSVWVFTILSYVIFTIAYYLWDSISLKKLTGYHQKRRSAIFLESLKLFLNYAPRKLPYLDSGKLLVISYLLMAFVLINEFEGTFLTFLNRPVYYRDIDTLEELEESKLSIRTSFSSVENTLNQDPSLTGIVRNIKVVDFNDRDGVATSGSLTQTPGSGGLLRMDSFKAKYLVDFVKANSTEPLHVVRECPLSYFIAYFVPRGSPFLDSFNTIIARCVTAGLVTKWSWDTNYATFNEMRPYKRGERDENAYNSFSLSDLQFPFLFYLGGTAISVIAFFIEIFVSNFQKRMAYLKYPTIYVNEFPKEAKPSVLIN